MFEESRDSDRQRRDGIRDSSGNQPSRALSSPEEWDMALSYSKHIAVPDRMRRAFEATSFDTWNGLVGSNAGLGAEKTRDYRRHLRVFIRLLDQQSVGIDFAEDVLSCISEDIGVVFEYSVTDRTVKLTHIDYSSWDQSELREAIEANSKLGPVLEPPLLAISDRLITALQRLALPVILVEQQDKESSAITYRLQYPEGEVKQTMLTLCALYLFRSDFRAIESKHYDMILMTGRVFADPAFLVTASFTSLTSFRHFIIEVMEERHPTLSFGQKKLWPLFRGIVDLVLDERFKEPPESDTARLLRQLRESFSSGPKVLAAAGAAALSAAALKLLASYF